MTTDLLEQMGRVVVAQSDLIDRLTALVMSDRETVGELAGAVTRLQDDAALWKRAHGSLFDDLAELRDFVHGLNDRVPAAAAR